MAGCTQPFRGALLEGLIPGLATYDAKWLWCCQPSSLNARLSAVASAFVQFMAVVRRWLPGPVAWRVV